MNQREFTRVRTAIAVDVTIGGQVLAGTTKDVSLNGCFVTDAPSMPAEDTPCRLEMHLDGRGGAIRVIAEGTVARCRSEGFGVKIDELLEVESYEHLRNLIRYNAADPDQAEFEFESHLGLKRVDPSAPPPPD